MIKKLLFVILLVLVLGVISAHAQTGNEEANCTDTPVIYCENFADRPLGNMTGTSSYKNLGYTFNNGSHTANGCFIIVNRTGPQGTTVHVLDEQYPDCTVPCSDPNQSDGGCGYVDGDGAWGSGNNKDLYIRFYVQYTANWQKSVIAAKQLEYLLTTNFNVYLLHQMGASDDNLGVQFGPPTGNPIQYFSNLAQTSIPDGVGTSWTCVEEHVKLGTANNGIVEQWVNGTKTHNFTNTTNWTDASTSMIGLRYTTNWNCTPTLNSNCAGQHPANMHRYYTNVLVSTSAIGCLGAVITPPPADPTNLLGCVGGGCLPASLGAFGILILATMCYRKQFFSRRY